MKNIKKLSNRIIYFLALLLIVSTACVNDDELLFENTPTANSESISKSLDALSEQLGALSGVQGDLNPISSMILDLGFDFVYPIQLAYNNGSVVTVKNLGELQVIVEALSPNLFIDEIAFPFSIKILNQENKKIEKKLILNETEFEDLIVDLNIGVYGICSSLAESGPVFAEIIKLNGEKETVKFSDNGEAACYGFSEEDFVDNPVDCLCTADYNPVYIEVKTHFGIITVLEYPNACVAYCFGYTENDFTDNILTNMYPESVDCFTFKYPISLEPDNSQSASNLQFRYYPFSIFKQGNEIVINSESEFNSILSSCSTVECPAVHDPVYVEVTNPNGLIEVKAYSNTCYAKQAGYIEDDFLNDYMVDFSGRIDSCGDFNIHQILGDTQLKTSLNIVASQGRESLDLTLGIKEFILPYNGINLDIADWDHPLIQEIFYEGNYFGNYHNFCNDVVYDGVDTPTKINTFRPTTGILGLSVTKITPSQIEGEFYYEIDLMLKNVIFENDNGEKRFIKNLKMSNLQLGWYPG